MEPIRLIVGLGNPGRGVRAHPPQRRLLVGGAIAGARGGRWAKESKFFGWVARVSEGGSDFWLLKPADLHERQRPQRGRVPALLPHRAAGDAGRARRARPAAGHREAQEGRRHRRAQRPERHRRGRSAPGTSGACASASATRATRTRWPTTCCTRRGARSARRSTPRSTAAWSCCRRSPPARLNDATTWLHTPPKAEVVVPVDPVVPAKADTVIPAKAGIQPTKETP